MPPAKSTPKKGGSVPNAWTFCETCSSTVISRDAEIHSQECPPNLTEISHNFVKDQVIYGTVDVKTNTELKGIGTHDRDNMVFLSQSVIQLCELSIGDLALIQAGTNRFTRIVWPTMEKSLTSILFTKNSMDSTNLKSGSVVKVCKMNMDIQKARKLTVTLLNGPKSLELSAELENRLQKSHLEWVVTDGNILMIMFYGKLLHFQIMQTEFIGMRHFSIEEAVSELCILSKFAQIDENTSFVLFKNNHDYNENLRENGDPFLKIGGLLDEISEISNLLNRAIGDENFLFKPTRSILLHGYSGTGKTLLINAFAATVKVNVVRINSADLYGKFSGVPEENIKTLFRDAVERAPSLILFDDVDLLCPVRNSRMTDSEKRISSTVLTLLDDLKEHCKVFIIAATNKLDSVDPTFRRCGRFEREIEIPIPNPAARFHILQKIVPEEYAFLEEISNNTHGFVGADLVALCSRAYLHASQSDRNELIYDDFKFALIRVRPSAMRQVQIEVPNVKWSDIGGQKKLKLILKQCVEWPLKHADSFTRMGITPPRGVLMYGPPGCSKTMIAKALATESGLNFLSIKGPELFSKWVGESERAVRDVFAKARQVAPSIVFFDEIDALGGERGGSGAGSSSSVQERVLAQLLTELDGVSPLGDVTILAATNRPDRIDKALLRPGRLDRIVYVELPDEQTRYDIFRIKLGKMPISNVDIEVLVGETAGYSGAEINAVCHEAAMMALEENIEADVVEMRHFFGVLDVVKPRTPKYLLDIYYNYNLNAD